jgi:drug/metabolite transporter (DMT)-like permease
MSARAWVYLLILSVLWGGSFFAARIAVMEIPPLTLVFIRVSLAALAINLVLAANGQPMPWRVGRTRLYLVMGLLNNVVPFSLIFYGTQTIGAGLASILNATTPIFAVLIAHVFTRDDRLTPGRSLGVVLGFIGVAVMLGFSTLADLGEHLLAELAVIAASLSYSVSTLVARRLRSDPPLQTAGGTLLASAVIALPLFLAFDQPWTIALPSVETGMAVLFLALMSTALAYWFYFRIVALAGASNVTLVTLLVPASAILLGMVFLDESLAPRHWAGMALIAVGLIAIDGRLLRR